MKMLHSGRLYWPGTASGVERYPIMDHNIETEVAIVGGGVSGLLCAHALSEIGIDAVLVERGEIAGGSTSASSGLLQYCNDVMLVDLIDQIGRQSAVRFYKSCAEAIDRLEDIARSLPEDVGFIRRRSLYYASTEQDLPKLAREYEAHRSSGFDVEYWDGDVINRHFPFRKPGAMVTNGDAEINPSRFVHALANAAAHKGARLFEHTDIVGHDTNSAGQHRLHTADGHALQAKSVIYAVGYEPEELRGRLIKADLNRSFVIVTGVQVVPDNWYGRFLIWETARPYYYLRTTEDGRIVAGGLDEDSAQPLKGKQAISKRSRKLLAQVQALFPHIDASVEYEWSATFGESRDNLPFIGEDPKWPGVYYCLGYGGNGTVYSAIAALLLRDLITGQTSNPLGEIVSLSRAALHRPT